MGHVPPPRGALAGWDWVGGARTLVRLESIDSIFLVVKVSGSDF